MIRPIRRLAPLATIGLLSVGIAIPATASAATTRTCKISGQKSQSMGPTYVATATGRTQFQVRVTSCANGERVIRAYHACRRANGGAKGRCSTRVRGYSCTERRVVAPSPVRQFEADVACRNGTARVLHHYTQRT